MDNFTDFTTFLSWASTPVGLIAIGAALSIFVRDLDWFERLPPKRKSSFMFIVLVIALPLLLIYIPGIVPTSAISSLDKLFKVFMLGATAYLANQGTHEFFNQRVKKRKLDSEAYNDPMDSMIDDM